LENVLAADPWTVGRAIVTREALQRPRAHKS